MPSSLSSVVMSWVFCTLVSFLLFEVSFSVILQPQIIMINLDLTWVLLHRWPLFSLQIKIMTLRNYICRSIPGSWLVLFLRSLVSSWEFVISSFQFIHIDILNTISFPYITSLRIISFNLPFLSSTPKFPFIIMNQTFRNFCSILWVVLIQIPSYRVVLCQIRILEILS